MWKLGEFLWLFLLLWQPITNDFYLNVNLILNFYSPSNGHTPRTISSIVTVTPADLLGKYFNHFCCYGNYFRFHAEPTFPCPHCRKFSNCLPNLITMATK